MLSLLGQMDFRSKNDVAFGSLEPFFKVVSCVVGIVSELFILTSLWVVACGGDESQEVRSNFTA